MFENLFQLIHKAADKEIKLLVQPGTAMPHLKEALIQFMAYVVQYEKEQIAEQEKASIQQEKPQE
jgi:DNA invertase Pin-like site-specific DNA recombinase